MSFLDTPPSWRIKWIENKHRHWRLVGTGINLLATSNRIVRLVRPSDPKGLLLSFRGIFMVWIFFDAGYSLVEGFSYWEADDQKGLLGVPIWREDEPIARSFLEGVMSSPNPLDDCRPWDQRWMPVCVFCFGSVGVDGLPLWEGGKVVAAFGYGGEWRKREEGNNDGRKRMWLV